MTDAVAHPQMQELPGGGPESRLGASARRLTSILSLVRLSDMRIPLRIAIACLLPMLGFTLFAGMDLLDKWSAYSRSQRIANIAEAAPTITALVHQLQIERGGSAGFLNSKGRAFGDTVRNQRPVIDKALGAWQKSMGDLGRLIAGTKFASNLSAAQSKLSGLAENRKGVDGQSITTGASTEYYTSTIATLVGLVDALGAMAEDGRIVKQATVWTALVRRKEYAGQERAMGAAGFGAGEFSVIIYQGFLRARFMGDAQADIVSRNASQAQVDFVAQTLKGPVTDEFLRLRAIGAAAPFTLSTESITGPEWFGVSTKYINILKQVEDRLGNDFVATVQTVVAEARWGFWGLMAIFIGLLAVTSLLTIVIALSITRPIAHLVSTMGELAQGNNDVELPEIGRKDEIGQMARAVLVFRDAAVEKLRLEGETNEQRTRTEEERRKNAEAQAKAAEEQAQAVRALADGLGRVASGDLTVRLNDGFTEAYQQIRDDFNATIAQLQETIGAIAVATREVASTAVEISTSTTDLSQRTEEQAASLEETSASMEEMSATVKKNAENAQQANQFTGSTREIADRGGEVVAQAVGAMARIEESSRKISDIISVIDEIARQTNLLALNAAVEAARAGEAGRGFAVVASEVRSLAQRSSQAAKDIKDLITNSSGQVQEGVELVNRAGASLNEIVESIKRVADIVSDIATASAEQSTGIDQVNTALAQMDEVTQQNSALVEQNAAAAKALEQQAHAMDERVSFFQIDAEAPKDGTQPHQVVDMRRPPAAVPKAAAAAAKAAPATAAKREPVVPRRSPVGRMQAALATAFQQDSEWKEF